MRSEGPSWAHGRKARGKARHAENHEDSIRNVGPEMLAVESLLEVRCRAVEEGGHNVGPERLKTNRNFGKEGGR